LELTKQQSSDYKRLGRIVGFVRNPQGQPVGKATLVLVRGAAPVGATQPENPTGVYELEWYPPGTYSVLGTAPGHKTSKYSGRNISAGESLWLDVTLQPK
ncbi:MAG: carboxypeptidase-like regulatory domain-containing protein, partial [Armatimonadota bacterium]